MAIASLSITAERQRIVEFSQTFLTQGISILAYKPKKNLPGMFSFLNPLSEWVWLSILASYVGVSGAFYAIYRLTTYQQKEEEKDNHNIVRANGDLNRRGGGAHNRFYQVRKKKDKTERVPVSNFLWMGFSILTSARGTWFVSK